METIKCLDLREVAAEREASTCILAVYRLPYTRDGLGQQELRKKRPGIWRDLPVVLGRRRQRQRLKVGLCLLAGGKWAICLVWKTRGVLLASDFWEPSSQTVRFPVG